MDVDNLCMGCLEPRGDQPACAACGWIEGSAPVNAVHLKPRTVVHGHYVLGRALGHGGFGIAYIAWDTNLQMKVAVKEFLPGDHATRGTNGTTVTPYSGDSREHFEYGLTRFLDEGRAVARFNDHPGIMPVLGFFRENGTGYLVMQYVPGMTLKKYLDLKGGRIPFTHAVDIAMPVMDTLRVVHEVGLLHRDISPDNIYISTARRVKLLDFGAARLALGDRSKSLSVILKAGYAPFEQYQTRGRQGPWTDVYALAATLYRCVTGEAPPEAPSRVADDDLTPPSAMGVTIAPDAEAVLLRALAIDVKARFQHVQEFQEALLGATPESPRPVSDVAIDPAGRAHVRRTGQPGETAYGDALPGPSVTTGAAVARALNRLIDVVERPAAALARVVGRGIGWRLPLEEEASMRQPALVVGLAIGAIGALLYLWSSIAGSGAGVPRSGFSSMWWTLRLLGGLLGSMAIGVGAASGLAGDRRGAAVLWSAGWFVMLFTLAGVAVQLACYVPYTALRILLGTDVYEEATRAIPVLIPIAVLLTLLRLHRPRAIVSPPDAASASSPGTSSASASAPAAASTSRSTATSTSTSAAPVSREEGVS
jgi:hypothetical protein